MKRSTQSRKTPLVVMAISYSVEDAALALGISRSLVFRLIRENKLTAVRIGRRTLVPVKSCEDLLTLLAKVV